MFVESGIKVHDNYILCYTIRQAQYFAFLPYKYALLFKREQYNLGALKMFIFG